jgi:hypothetical protein
MKKSILTFASALLLLSCSQAEKHLCISPISAGYTADSLTDCRVAANFTVDDINWSDSQLTMEVYAENVYDQEQVGRMQVGDTLVYEGKPMVVKNIEKTDSTVTINGGLEEGGAWLQPNEGSTWRAVQFDDHSVYTKLGKATVALGSNIVITDCGVNPTDSIIYVTKNPKQYLDGLSDTRRQFNCLDTKVLIEGGKVAAITRIWIP